MGIMVNKHDFLSDVYTSIKYTELLTVVLIDLAIFVAMRFSNRVRNPLKECSERLNKLVQGHIDGYEDKTFRTNEDITRQEAAKIVASLADLKKDGDQDLRRVKKYQTGLKNL